MMRSVRLSRVARPSLVAAFAVGAVALGFDTLPGGQGVAIGFASVGMAMAFALGVAKA